MRLIDADTLIPKLKFIREAEHQIYGKESWGFANKCITAIEDAPTITTERKHSKWIPYEDEDGVRYGHTCFVCGAWYIFPYGKSNYCPNCGLPMLEEEEKEKK